MQDNNKAEKSYFKSAGITVSGLKILFGFSFVATIIAFSIAFCEHRQYTELVGKYDDAIERISQCEASVSELMNGTSYHNSIENTAVVTTTIKSEENADYTQEHTTMYDEEVTTKAPLQETVPDKADKTNETTKVKETSGTYYVTQSGKKYHVSTCSYLNKSKIAITMDRIKAEGYSPCSRCIK